MQVFGGSLISLHIEASHVLASDHLRIELTQASMYDVY